MRHPCVYLAFLAVLALPVLAQEGQGIVVTVSDKPITTFDIAQRVKLLKVVRGSEVTRKQALQSAIDDVIKREEAKKLKAEPTEAMIDQQLGRMAKNSNSSVSDVLAKFKAQGVSASAVRGYVASQLAFNRVIGSKGAKPTVDQVAVEKKYADLKAEFARIAKDPRMKPVTIYKLQEILMPVEQAGDAMTDQLYYARSVEAQQVMQRYKGCSSAKAAAAGIFNVRVGKILEADASKLPKMLKAALDKAGPGRAVGPVRSKQGLQVIGFCGKRSIAPKMPDMPSRQAIENSVYNDQFDVFEEAQLKELRKGYVIDYKDTAYAQ